MDFALHSALLKAFSVDLEVLHDFVVACGGTRDEINYDACKSALMQIFSGSGGRGKLSFSKCVSIFFKA